MYVKDMVKVFVHMDALKKTSRGRFEERFQEVYGQDPPKANMYHDQVQKWNLAPSPTQNTALAAGGTVMNISPPYLFFLFSTFYSLFVTLSFA